jgi:tryptophan synthase beta chain
MFGIECKVYMVRISYDQKPYRRVLMQTWGASVVASPSRDTNAGRAELERDENSTGSLGLAISEAVEDVVTHDNTKYALGSVLNHVLLHQSVIGQETIKQLEVAGADWPDVVIGCAGGGSNFAGLAFPFLHENIAHGRKSRILAVEPAAAPSLTKGVYAYDFGDTAGMTPLVKMHTLGHSFIPAPIHAGGLRYHGMSAQVSALKEAGLIEAINVPQRAIFDAAMSFTRAEGILPAPESAHAILAAMQEAERATASGERKTIVFNLSGHGHFDLGAYEAYLTGKLQDYELPDAAIQESLAQLPLVA